MKMPLFIALMGACVIAVGVSGAAVASFIMAIMAAETQWGPAGGLLTGALLGILLASAHVAVLGVRLALRAR